MNLLRENKNIIVIATVAILILGVHLLANDEMDCIPIVGDYYPDDEFCAIDVNCEMRSKVVFCDYFGIPTPVLTWLEVCVYTDAFGNIRSVESIWSYYPC